MHQPAQQTMVFGRTDKLAQGVRIKQQLDLLRTTVEMLTREGHTILAAGIGEIKPFVFLAPTTTLAHLADEGKAAYWMRGHDDSGPYRKGQLIDYRNVFVYWMERGH